MNQNPSQVLSLLQANLDRQNQVEQALSQISAILNGLPKAQNGRTRTRKQKAKTVTKARNTTFPDLMLSFLQSHNGPATTAEVKAHAIANGYSGEGISTSINNALSKNPTIKRVGRGLYAVS